MTGKDQLFPCCQGTMVSDSYGFGCDDFRKVDGRCEVSRQMCIPGEVYVVKGILRKDSRHEGNSVKANRSNN